MSRAIRYAPPAGVLLTAGLALATPRENVQFLAVPSNGILNSPANAVRLNTFVGGYTLGRIDFSGTLTAVSPTTWRSDSRILITAPTGQTLVYQPFTTGTTFTTLSFSGSAYMPAGTSPAGEWTFRYFEYFDDGGTAQVDATWNITITLTDEQAAPPAAVQLGTLAYPGPSIAPASLAAGQVLWYRFTTPVGLGPPRYLDVDTFGSVLDGLPPNDTMLALYDGTGQLVAMDDNSGDGYAAALSFGAGTRPGAGDGLPFNGRNGSLPAGTYYLAITGFPASLASSRWEVASTSTYGGTIALTLATNVGGPCYANCDNSTTQPILNVLDFNCFLNRFSSGDTYANCDGSTVPPVLNVLDFNCFLNAFAAGCP
jgi:hypothetical protein